MNVKIYSNNDLNERLKSGKLENALLIAFYDPQYNSPTDFSGKAERVVTLPVPDLDKDDLEEYGYTEKSYFSQADSVAGFIIKAVRDGLDIACGHNFWLSQKPIASQLSASIFAVDHCEFGESRSAGCAAAIKEFYDGNGIEIFADERYYPNKIIFNKLLAALRKQSDTRKFYVHNLPYDKKVSLALLEHGYLSAGEECGLFSDFKIGDVISVPINKEEFYMVKIIELPQSVDVLNGLELYVMGEKVAFTDKGVLYQGKEMCIKYIAKIEKCSENTILQERMSEAVRMKLR